MSSFIWSLKGTCLAMFSHKNASIFLFDMITILWTLFLKDIVNTLLLGFVLVVWNKYLWTGKFSLNLPLGKFSLLACQKFRLLSYQPPTADYQLPNTDLPTCFSSSVIPFVLVNRLSFSRMRDLKKYIAQTDPAQAELWISNPQRPGAGENWEAFKLSRAHFLINLLVIDLGYTCLC